MQLVVAVVLALASCGYTHRGIEIDRDVVELEYQNKALFYFESIVEDLFSVELPDVWNDITVYYTTTPCPGTERAAVIYNDVCYSGIMFNCDEVFVAVGDDLRVCGTSLVHEFAHCLSLYLSNGTSYDGNHEGPIWAEVGPYIQNEVCQRGW